MITEAQIHSLSRRWGIDQVTIMREYLQILFLSHLYGLARSDKVFFKGGTAIRFLKASFRFSEDLDFTSTLPPEQVAVLFGRAVFGLSREAEGVGIEKFKVKKNSIISRIKHKAGKNAHSLGIHLEISVREKPLTKKVSQIETLLPISPYPIITHLSDEEILSEKVRALLKRAKGRDLFDVWFLMTKEVKLNWNMVEKKMKFYGEGADFGHLVSKIQLFDEKKLVQDLAKFLPRRQRKLIPDLQANVIKRLEEIRPSLVK